MSVLISIGTIMVLSILILWIIIERQLWPRRSTLEFWNVSQLPLTKKLEGYLYAARTEWYLRPAAWPWLVERLKHESPDSYHGKMLIREDAAKLITLQQPVELRNLDHVIPYPVARDIILNHPVPSLAVLECPCRSLRPGGCQPRDVCLVVGEPYTSFLVDHRPDKARRITAGEALDIISAEEKRGHIHTAWFKDVMHNRFYAICNCCTCCCLGMQSFDRGISRLAHSGYRPLFDHDGCNQCGVCIGICPFQALELQAELPCPDPERCLGCGLCVSHCPTGAIELALAPDKGIPLDIQKLAY